MIEQATVDTYGDYEQITGWLTMIEENLAVPFETKVLG
ncbi:MAG: calcium-binding protein, partial [Steroidobacteraceae bacterium]